MNSTQEDKLSMYYAVKNVCETNRPAWFESVVFANSCDLWLAKIPMIEQNRHIQMNGNTGPTTNKTGKRVTMTDSALFIANRLQSYANVTGNPELAESVAYSATDMKKARDTDVAGMCNIVLGKATLYATNIEDYGVTASLITDLQLAITDYSEALATPQAAKSQVKTATAELVRLFKEADDVLTKRMDLDIEVFKTSVPEFYGQYHAARLIVATGGRTTSLLGKVTLAGSQEPVKGVTFTFTPETNGTMKAAATETLQPIVKKSALKGNFRIASLPEGTYQVTVKKTGFKELVLTTTVVSGETTNLKVEIERT